MLLQPSQHLLFGPEIDLAQFGSTCPSDRVCSAFERDCGVLNEHLPPRKSASLPRSGSSLSVTRRIAEQAIDLLMVRSAHWTADETRFSVRGLGRLLSRSSGVFRCRATRIPATMANTLLRPSSISLVFHPSDSVLPSIQNEPVPAKRYARPAVSVWPGVRDAPADARTALWSCDRR